MQLKDVDFIDRDALFQTLFSVQGGFLCTSGRGKAQTHQNIATGSLSLVFRHKVDLI